MFEEIYKKIEESPVIVIYRHTEPDMDALGSQAGLKEALKGLFPDKEIYAAGLQTRKGFEMDIIDDDTAKNALGILLDTSNRERVDDERFFDSKETIRLDHHIKVDTLADLDYVDEKAGATGEVVASLFQSLGKDISKEAAQHLYQALTADTARFTTSSTTPESLEVGAWLLRQGASVVKTDQANNGMSMADFKYGALVRRKATVMDHLLFAVMSKTDWMTCGLDVSIASKKSFLLGGVSGIDIWALFTEDSDGTFFASLRSRTKKVRDLAAEYGGGGHECAAGIKGLSASQVVELTAKLAKCSLEEPEPSEAEE